MPKLSVVIPVFNSESFLTDAIEQFLALQDIGLQIICVNDGSTDASRDVLNILASAHPEIEVIHLEENQGAGIARNIGFEKVNGEYVYFFDADDKVHAQTLKKAIALAEATQSEIAMCGYYLADKPDGKGPMHGFDSDKWKRILGPQNWTVVNSDKIVSLLATTNYPWNKVLSADYARRIKLRFGKTRVHNDILGHWIALLHATRMVLMNDAICTHIVPEKGKNLTKIQDRRRLSVFDALSDLDRIIDLGNSRNPSSFIELTKFKVIVLKWARSNIAPEHLDEFDERAGAAFNSVGVSEYLEISRNSPSIAKDMKKLRFGI